ncbi:hypothetical protein LTR66_017187, partial [Elasticomyces elasticus]
MPPPLQAAPMPGVALLATSNIPQVPLSLSMRGEGLNRFWLISTADGTTLYKVDSHTVTASARKTITDGFGNPVCTVRRDFQGLKYRYYGQFGDGDSAQRVFEMKSKTGLGGVTCTLSFVNRITGQSEEMVWKNGGWSRDSTMVLWGVGCADVHET